MTHRRTAADGCCPPEESCARGLPDLVRPRFYPGQVLTDRDLRDLETWVRARFGLARLRDGWGVVCGLPVAADPERPGGVVVGAGYAVDAAGDDLVLREPLKESLPRPSEQAVRDCTRLLAAPAEGSFDIGPFQVPVRDLAVFDLVACHAATGDAPVTAPGCRPQPRCEWSRTRDGIVLKFVPVPLKKDGTPDTPARASTQDPVTDLLKAFAAAFPPLANWQRPVAGDSADLPKPESIPGGKSPAKWLADYLDTHPGPFYAWDWLREPATDRRLRTPWTVAAALFWLTRAARQGTAGCPDPVCDCPSAGVPLARVWAQRQGGGFVARFVSMAPDTRRAYGRDRASGPLVVASHLERPVGEVEHDLKQARVTVQGEPFDLPADAARLQLVYGDEAKIDGLFTPGRRYTAWVTRPSAGAVPGPRVVAFRPGDPDPSPLIDPNARISAGRPLEIHLYYPDASQTEFPPKFVTPDAAQMTALGTQLDADALPLGATVQILVRTDERLSNAAQSVHLHNDLTEKVYDVPGPAVSKAILAQVTLRKTVSDGIAITVVAADLAANPTRMVTLSGIVDKTIQAVPLTGDTGPKIYADTSAPDAGLTVGGVKVTNGSELLALDGTNTPDIRVKGKIQISNPSPSDVTGTLQKKIAGGDWGDVKTVSVAKGTKAEDTNLAPIDEDLTDGNHTVSYRLVEGKDKFLRPFAPDPVLLGVSVRSADLAAKITDTVTGSNTRSVVGVRNGSTDKTYTVLSVKGQSCKPALGPEVTPPVEFTLAPGESKKIELRNDQQTVAEWRVTVTYRTQDGKRQTAVGFFTPEHP